MLLRLSKSIVFCLSLLLLTQCTKVNMDGPVHRQVNQPIASPYTMPASAYLALANNQADSEKQSLLILAAGRYIYDGQWRQGLHILTQTDQLTPELNNEKLLLLAKVDLIREQPRAAISRLALVQGIHHLPIYYQAQYHEMLASAYQTTGNYLQSILERIKLDELLKDEASLANNRRALWLSLTTLPKAEIDAISAEAKPDSVLSGWTTLALLSRNNDERSDLLQQVQAWREMHPQHPANAILPSPLFSIQEKLYPAPKRIALMLPLSGVLSGPGLAVKDGFMAALDASHAQGRINVQVYDTNGANVEALYQKAIDGGAQFVVGPLSKPDVAKVASMSHPVPTLLLNDLETSTKNNAYQFGLSPSNEARQVAVKARKNGHIRALVIAPTGPWSDEIVSAFAKQWRVNGGEVVDTLRYGPNDDLSQNIRNLLGVSESEVRGKRLKKMMPHVESTPSRRQDFDMVFLLAYPSYARQIVPLLRYYFVEKEPIYATSTVYSGSADTMKDRDLNGVIFCDMPWVFSHQAGNRNWPEQFNSYNRLYALGMDSFALTTQLNQLLLFPAMGVRDNSGILYLTPWQQVARISAWGQFRGGVAQIMNDGH